MKTPIPFSDRPVDKSRSLSMLLALGMVMANGARADARANRERLLRRLHRDDGIGPDDEGALR
jgi:hypothetical protein